MKTTFALLFLFQTSYFVRAQSVTSIIDKYEKAVGGSVWSKINSISILGDFSVKNSQSLSIRFQVLNHKGYRLDMVTSDGQNGFTIANPESGWQFLPFAGQIAIEKFDGQELRDLQQYMDINASKLTGCSINGSNAVFLGKDSINNDEYYKLKINRAQAADKIVFISSSNFFLNRTIDTIKAQNYNVVIIRDFLDYQRLPEGIWVPSIIKKRQLINGVEVQSSVFKYVEYKVNVPINDSIFRVSSN